MQSTRQKNTQLPASMGGGRGVDILVAVAVGMKVGVFVGVEVGVLVPVGAVVAVEVGVSVAGTNVGGGGIGVLVGFAGAPPVGVRSVMPL